MNFKIIEALLMAANGSTGTLDADVVHLKSAKNSTDNFYHELEKAGLSEANIPEGVEDAMLNMVDEYERQGFISGFRMGARLMLECIGPAPLEAWDPNDISHPLSRVT